jgi:hypothetical protein
MKARIGGSAALDPLYQLAMLRVGELQCEATRGREFRRFWGQARTAAKV